MPDQTQQKQQQQPGAAPPSPGGETKTTEPPQPRHVADEPVGEADALDAGLQSPMTETGLPVEEQVRKEWDPNKDGGLPIPLRAIGATGRR
jgi:hypothetical protein